MWEKRVGNGPKFFNKCFGKERGERRESGEFKSKGKGERSG